MTAGLLHVDAHADRYLFSESQEGKLKEWILAKYADSAFDC